MAAASRWVFVIAWKSVDLPENGSPTMPSCMRRPPAGRSIPQLAVGEFSLAYRVERRCRWRPEKRSECGACAQHSDRRHVSEPAHDEESGSCKENEEHHQSDEIERRNVEGNDRRGGADDDRVRAV